MSFVQYLDDLLLSFCSLDFLILWYAPLIAFAFLATFPRIVRSFTAWR